MAFSYKNYTESNAVKKLREQLAQYNAYKESQAVTDSYNAYKQKEANKIADWTGGTYGQALKDQMDKINNRKQFTYDLNGDALYQQYKDQYMTQGRLASADAIGQASAMTGGYGNSYAATVGNQAYQGYLQKLNDVVPELYNMAYNRYQQEGQDMKDMLAMYESAYGREYGEHRDKVGDYNTELARLQDAYYNEKNFDYNKFSADRTFYNDAYNNERTYDYGQYNDAYNRAFGQYQQGVAEQQWQKEYNLKKSQADQSATIKSLQSKISGMINPDDIEVDENGNITSVKGYNLAGNSSGNKNSGVYTGANISGFKTDTNDNFKVSVGGKNYTVENKGKVTQNNIKTALDKQKSANGDILSYGGEAYYNYKGTYYKLGAVGLIGKGDYSKLLSALKG